MQVQLAEDDLSTNYVSATSEYLVSEGEWTYLIYSFDMDQIKNMNVIFWRNDNPIKTVTLTDVFQIDSTAYSNYIGAVR